MNAELQALISRIQSADAAAMGRAATRQTQLTKPAGALGDLEGLSVRLAGVFGTERPAPQGAAVLVAAADHGVAREGVSAYPREVTPAMVLNFLADTPAGAGGAAVNAIARSVGAEVYVMDAGVDAELPCRQRDALGMVAGRGRDDAAGLLLLGQLGHAHVGAADLEGSGALHVLALEVDLAAQMLGQYAGVLHGGQRDDRLEDLRCFFDIRQADRQFGFSAHDSSPRDGR